MTDIADEDATQVMALQLFEQLDPDHNGLVSKASLTAYLSDIQEDEVDDESLAKIFGQLGTGDKITFDDFMEGFARYMLEQNDEDDESDAGDDGDESDGAESTAAPESEAGDAGAPDDASSPGLASRSGTLKRKNTKRKLKRFKTFNTLKGTLLRGFTSKGTLEDQFQGGEGTLRRRLSKTGTIMRNLSRAMAEQEDVELEAEPAVNLEEFTKSQIIELLHERDTRVSGLKHRVAKYEARFAAMGAKLSEAKQEAGSFEDEVYEIQDLLDQAKIENERLVREVENMNTMMLREQQSRATLRSNYARLEKKERAAHEELTLLREQVTEAERGRSKLREKNEKLEREVVAHREKMDSDSMTTGAVKELEETVETLEEELAAMTRLRDDGNRRIDDLEKQKHQAAVECSEWKGQARILDSELKTARKEAAASAAKSPSSLRGLDTSGGAKALEGKLRDSRRETASIRDELARRATVVETAERDLIAERKVTQKLQKEIEDLKDQLWNAKSEIATLKASSGWAKVCTLC